MLKVPEQRTELVVTDFSESSMRFENFVWEKVATTWEIIRKGMIVDETCVYDQEEYWRNAVCQGYEWRQRSVRV
jgi:hypothetical protein